MPHVKVLPHPTLCPQGATIDVPTGVSIGKALVAAKINVPHACEFNGACATCHIIVREGYDTLAEPTDAEYDKLDAAFGSTPLSRLACCAAMGEADITIEIPVYNRNIVGER